MNEKSGWKKIPLKWMFSGRNTGAWGDEPESENGTICIRAADFITEKVRHSTTELTRRKFEQHEMDSKQLQPGDLVIEKSGGGENQPVGRVVVFDLDEPALCSNFLERIRINGAIVDTFFAGYLLYSLWAKKAVIPFIKQTTGIQNLDIEEYFTLKVDLPPIDEQRLIVDYLYHKVSYIDDLIDAKRQLLKLLAEKRQALIISAVTRGINSNVSLNNTGITWLGVIPNHWEIEFSHWLFNEIDERSETGDEELLSVSHLTGVTPRSEKDVNMFMAETNEGYKVCQPGDLVINTLWAWMGAMGVAFQHGLVSPAYNVYRPTGRYNSRYLDFLVRVPNFAKEATRYSKGVWSSRLRLYPEEFFLIQMPVPPLDEQQEIVDYLDREINKIDRLSQATQSSIALLSERRTALISAAVTGQIEITEASCN